MISDSDFYSLINNNEGTILDYKFKFYNFKNDHDKRETAKFVKDVISFTNTVRTEPAYIIFGIKELDNKEIELSGISDFIDDSILQEKVKDKVIPRPNFEFFYKKYENKTFGIIRFPLVRYEFPLMPSVNNLKGLEQGKVYYRSGSSNSEANAIDIIRINDWFKSLPKYKNSDGLNDLISEHLKNITEGKIKLSTTLSELYVLAKKDNIPELRKFCEYEIKGSNAKEVDEKNHRTINCIISWNKVDVNPYSMVKSTPETLKKELLEHEEFYQYKIALNYPIIKLENMMDKIRLENNSFYGTLETNTQKLLGMKEKHKMFVYVFPEDIKTLYTNIKQKTIDILMKL